MTMQRRGEKRYCQRIIPGHARETAGRGTEGKHMNSILEARGYNAITRMKRSTKAILNFTACKTGSNETRKKRGQLLKNELGVKNFFET